MLMSISPECAGQIVEISYGADEYYAYRRIYDQSDRTVEWSRAAWDDLPDAVYNNYEPWNREPRIPESLWVSCDEPGEE